MTITLFCDHRQSTHGIDEAWIGLTKSDDDCAELICRRSNWMWADATTYDPNDWHDWYDQADGGHEPGRRETCVRMNKDIGWLGRSCSVVQFGYICEKGN